MSNPTTARRRNLRRFFAVSCLVLGFATCEILLRIQQYVGPIVELNWGDEYLQSFDPLYQPDEVLNHVKCATLPEWDQQGLYQFPNLPPLESLPATQSPIRCLYLGDSFMEGDGETSIPWFIWEQTRTSEHPIYPYNAGCGSYSPCIFVPQARRLIKLLSPDIVVVSIDRTDIVDDNSKRHLTDRDLKGSITNVRSGGAMQYLTARYREIRERRLYLSRLVSKLLLTKREWPAFRTWYKQQYVPDNCHDYATLFESPEAVSVLQGLPEVQYFERNLRDLFRTLDDAPGRQCILVTTHPHPQDFRREDRWNGLVSAVVANVAADMGVAHLETQPAMQRKFGNEPLKFYRPNDMHFNAAGLRVYADEIERKINEMPQLLNSSNHHEADGN